MEDLGKEEEVVLVDENNLVLGYMDKLEAHKKGLLHRAISVIIFNDKGEMLIQQRSFTKYHWAGAWSNTCCSHPRKHESFKDAAERRLFEELGFKTPLHEQFNFIYKANDAASGLTEYEFDTVFTGTYNQPFSFNTKEVNAISWVQPDALIADINANPKKYSFWFGIILDELKKRNVI
ncbi:MAG TPA: isopentenyl-diphosphate Delta-isomerase [Chitinophagales bacterium]|nr:isopentenyl-diphosphate Delta-isomerase [Chitinophagales bacterium]